jgi:hypothetical protein
MKSSLFIFLGFLLASAGISLPSNAGAAFHQVAGATCSLQSTSASDYSLSITGATGNQATATRLADCQFPSNSTLRHDAVTFLSVDVHDATSSGQVSAQACLRAFDGIGATCGSAQFTGFAAIETKSLFPSTSAWTAAGAGSDYPVVRVSLPARTTTTPSAVLGIYGSN